MVAWNPQEPAPDLLNQVMRRITAEQRARVVRIRFAVATTVFLGAIGLAVPIWQAFQQDIAQSGLLSYLGLALTDSRAVLMNWQDYGLSLVEALPVASTAELLSVVLAFLVSLRLFVMQPRLAATVRAA